MSAEGSASSGKKTKDRIQQLSELRRGLIHYTDAQYGTSEDPLFVMHIVVDRIVFQGVGPSKKRAKVMASECALAHIGAIDADLVQMPQPETAHPDDPTADVFAGLLYYNFEAPDESASDASLKLPLYEPENMDSYDEYDSDAMQEALEGYIGRNSVSILSELRPDAKYEIVFASCNSNPPRFVTSVRVKARSYCGDAKNKKISKARAAAMALADLYGIEFGTAEDGMPIYDGSTKVWETYKAHLEKELESESAPISVVNPIEQLNETFPGAKFEFPDGDSKYGGFFRARFTIAGNTYEGLGMNKRDAKANAAANTVEALEKSGLMQKRRAELEAKRKERQEKVSETETDDANKSTQKPDKELSHNPNVKLQELYPQVTYHVLGETPLRNTAIHAFIAGVVLSGQSFIGVGRSKKLAKTAAAEKALRALGFWTAEDEAAKNEGLKATKADVIPPLMDLITPDDGIHSLIESFGAKQRGRSSRGRGRWNSGFGSCGYHQRGRGRGYSGGYDRQEWHGGDPFGVETEGLDMMIGELSGLIGQILETNPNMGASDIWNMLQQNPEYQSWRSGAFASNYYQNYGAEYYGASADPSYGYSGEGYHHQPEAYMKAAGRGRGVNVRSWSRDSGSYINRGGKNTFQNYSSYW